MRLQALSWIAVGLFAIYEEDFSLNFKSIDIQMVYSTAGKHRGVIKQKKNFKARRDLEVPTFSAVSRRLRNFE